MNEQQNTDLIKKMYEAFSKGDLDFILSKLAEDVHWSSPGPAEVPYSGEYTGRAQVRKFFELLVGTQENLNLTVEKVIAHGDSVVVLGRYTGRVRATGRPFDSVVGHFSTIQDGKVKQWIGLGDTANAAAAYTAASAA
jgi:uncharacterized protein